MPRRYGPDGTALWNGKAPEEFTEDFVSILSGDLRHPQIQYYENEKKNAIAPKITSKAKTAVQEQINTTVIGKAAEALTTAGSVFKAMGLDSEALADGIMDKLTGARQEMAQLQQVLLSLKDVMNGADGLLTAASVTIADARGTVEDADAAAGSTVQLISTGLSAADTAYSDLLTVLNNTDKVLGDIEDALRSMDTSAADEALKADLHRKIQAAIDALEDQLAAAEDEAVKAQMETAIADLEALDALVDTLEPSALQGPVLDMLHQVRQELLAAAVRTNKEVNEYLHTTGSTFLTNCTAGFEIACKYTGLKPGDEVIVPAITFAATMAYPLSIGCKLGFGGVVPVRAQPPDPRAQFGGGVEVEGLEYGQRSAAEKVGPNAVLRSVGFHSNRF